MQDMEPFGGQPMNLGVFLARSVFEGRETIRTVVHDEDGDWMWLAGERSWQVRVTRHPTLTGDDQTSKVVAETEQLGRAAAHARALSMQDAIRRGDFQR